MANSPRRSSIRARATMVVGITLSIYVAVALFGWLVGWRTIDQYSTALRLAGAGAGLLGLLSLAGKQLPGADNQFSAASMEIEHQLTRGQSDYYQDVKRSFDFLLMVCVVGLLVAGGGFALELLSRG